MYKNIKYDANNKGDVTMKRKIIVLVITASLMVASAVSAASIWGSYKGNDIIRITSNGSPLKTSDVPAISYNGRTMIPISMLSQVGLGYTWDQNNKTVDVANQNSTITATAKDSILKASMFKYLEDLGESLTFVKTGFDLDVVSITAGTNISNKNRENLSTAVNDYNNFIKRSDVLNFGSTDPSIDKALNHYYNAIDGLKELDSIINSMPSNPNSTSLNNYFTKSDATSNEIYAGISIASEGFKVSIYEPLK